MEQRAESAQLREALAKPRKRPHRRFKHWLGERNPRLANLWKFRKRLSPNMEVRQFQFPKIGNMQSPYPAYRELIKKQFPEKMDDSRIDAAVALRMRVAGYTPQEAANEMYTKARPLRKESRDWKDYVRRTVWYAFGTAGDIDIAAFQPTQEKILSFHQETEKLEAAKRQEAIQDEPQHEGEQRQRPRMGMR
jgi:hypothetical protein